MMTDGVGHRRPKNRFFQNSDRSVDRIQQMNEDGSNDQLIFLNTLLEDQTVQCRNVRKLCARHRHSKSLDQSALRRIKSLQGAADATSTRQIQKANNQNTSEAHVSEPAELEDVDNTPLSPEINSSVPYTQYNSHSTTYISTPHDPTFSSTFAFSNNPFYTSNNTPQPGSNRCEEYVVQSEETTDELSLWYVEDSLF